METFMFWLRIATFGGILVSLVCLWITHRKVKEAEKAHDEVKRILERILKDARNERESKHSE